MKQELSASSHLKTEGKTVCVMGLATSVSPLPASSPMPDNRVIGVDVRPEVVNKINRGEIHIIETDLEDHVREAVNSGRLKASLTPQPADIFMICVPRRSRPITRPISPTSKKPLKPFAPTSEG